MLNLDTVGQSLELRLNFIDNLLVGSVDAVGRVSWHDVFTVDNLLDGRSQGSADVCVSDLGISRAVSNCLLGQVVEGDDDLEHTNSLNKRAGVIEISESILRQEIFADKLSNFHNDLLILGKGFLSDQLHNLLQVIFLLKNVHGSLTKARVLFIHSIEVWFQNLHVFGVRNEPVERREMLTLSKFLIQSPEDLDNRQSSGSDRIGEISTRRRHSTDDRNGTLAVRRSQALNTSGTFVESGQTSSQIGGVTGIGRHLTQTTGDLTKGLGPTRGRVSHHGHVHALITEVFSKGDTGVN
mmetsp:Transcript_5322/g.10991  ORF Transcript_5322/g.10991 Transcript_5322/m.10991 type:complete len:296 (+) Transcript_5322:186-1073(+)